MTGIIKKDSEVVFFKDGKVKARLDAILGRGLDEAGLAAFLAGCAI